MPQHAYEHVVAIRFHSAAMRTVRPSRLPCSLLAAAWSSWTGIHRYHWSAAGQRCVLDYRLPLDLLGGAVALSGAICLPRLPWFWSYCLFVPAVPLLGFFMFELLSCGAIFLPCHPPEGALRDVQNEIDTPRRRESSRRAVNAQATDLSDQTLSVKAGQDCRWCYGEKYYLRDREGAVDLLSVKHQ